MNPLTEKDIEELISAASTLANEAVGDWVYDIREREGAGWEGERVVNFGKAAEIINRLRKEGKI